MFRMQESNLPDDPTYPADLKALGFFINEAGQFRMIEYPEKDYLFHYSNNVRHNEVRREAMQICQRNEVMKRLSALGIEKLYLPQLITTKPQGQPHVAILAPPPEILRARKRVIVLVNDALQDLGVLAYRQLQRNLGVNGGSIINFVKESIVRSTEQGDDSGIFKDGAGIRDKEKKTPGLIVMNCGQLLYSYKYDQSMTLRSWSAMPRQSACHEPIQILPENHIEGNEDATAHIKFVFDNVIKNKDYVSEDAEVYVIAIENGAEYLLQVLGADLENYGPRITAMAIVNSFMSGPQIFNVHLKAFLHQRARQWKVATGASNPHECIEAPSNYAQEIEILDSSKKDTSSVTPSPAERVSWIETVAPPSTVSTVTNLLHRLDLPVQSRGESATEAKALDDRDDLEPVCPTFGDGNNPMSAGECVFTCPTVQRCILEFFEQVARDPTNFRNPVFKPSPSPLEYNDWNQAEAAKEAEGGEDSGDAAYQPLQAEMSPEQAELVAKKEELDAMKAALRDIPKGRPELEAGKEGLEKRIVTTEKEVEDLMTKTLATGGFKAGEAENLRESWKPVGKGPKIPFAGVMVDSELVKGVGLVETVEEELTALEKDDE